MTNEPQHAPIIETSQQARQAERGPTMRNVLIASLGLVVIVLIVVWLIFFHT